MLLVAPADPTFAATVRVAIAQMHAVDGDVAGNLLEVDRLAQSASAAGAQIVVFPELVDVGFDNTSTPPLRGAAAVPGSTTDALGEIASNRGVWIATAVLEAVSGGVYDTSVLIDANGKLVAKVRKNFVYPRFQGARAFDGNFHDMALVPSPWGPIGLMNCADLASQARRGVLVDLRPSLILLSFANPQANLLPFANTIAAEANAPTVGVNMVFPPSSGGESRFVAAGGAELWRAGSSAVLKTWDLTVVASQNRAPSVDAGDVQTIRSPNNQVALRGIVWDDGLSGPATSWSVVRGPGSVSFTNANDPATTATLATPGVYVLELTASDGVNVTRRRTSVNLLPASGDPSLVGHWTFDGTFTDSSGLGNHGTPTAGAAFSTDVAPIGSNARSLQLGGSDYVRIPDAPSLAGSGAVSIAAWVKSRTSFPGFVVNGGNDWAALLTKGPNNSESYHLGFGAYFAVFARGMREMLVPSLDERVLQPGVWFHVATVLDPEARVAEIYINGVRDHRVLSAGAAVTNSNPLFIGAAGSGVTGIDGLIDDVRLYSRALSDTEIAALVPSSTVNSPPSVNATAAQPAMVGAAVSLSGIVQDDAVPATSPAAAWVRWEVVSGFGAVEFANRFAANTTATFSSAGRHVLVLEASDGSNMASDTIAIDVQAGGGGGGATGGHGVLAGKQKLSVAHCRKATATFQGAWEIDLSALPAEWTLDALATTGLLSGEAVAADTAGRRWSLADGAGALTAVLNGILSDLAAASCGAPATVTGSRIVGQGLKLNKRGDRAKATLLLNGDVSHSGGTGLVILKVKAAGPWIRS